MPWSTRQLAELAGTSLRTVRHYHDVGLLAEPTRRSNGYKEYGAPHLVRLLQIRNLVDLGFTLAEIARMDDSSVDAKKALRRLDAELDTTIQRLEQARTHVRDLLEAPDHAAGVGPAMGSLTRRELTERDRGFLTVFGRIAGPAAASGYIDAVESSEGHPTLADLEKLPADADEATRSALVPRLADYMNTVVASHPELGSIPETASVDARRAAEAISAAIADLYNPAQVDVIARAAAARRE